MTETQLKIVEYFLDHDDWVSAKQIAETINVNQRHLHRLLVNKSLINTIQLERRYKGTTTTGRPAVQFRRKKVSTSEALDLAKQHTGLFGQLYWATQNA